jgi:hypothetical protein
LTVYLGISKAMAAATGKPEAYIGTYVCVLRVMESILYYSSMNLSVVQVKC